MPDYPLIEAFQTRNPQYLPLWYMRQAGRYLPEYNEIRKGKTFLDLSMTPELSIEVSLQPHRRYGMDGIIMFSDILTPVHAAGIPLHFEEGRGPVLEKTIREERELSLIDDYNPERDNPYVARTLQGIQEYIQGLSSEIRPALIGFAGAPFTLASYIVEGSTTRKFERTKTTAFRDTEFFLKLLDRLADITSDYLCYQIESGAQIVQLFDSWGGILQAQDYEEFSGQFNRKILSQVRQKAKKPFRFIMFTGNSAHLAEQIAEMEPDGMSLDWRTPDSVIRNLPEELLLQGNLDPLILYGKKERVVDATRKTIARFAGKKYIFNLGHGIHPSTPLENVQTMIDTVRAHRD
ncbi:MAG TPA: uroporphyrinogen decarboxylase [Leptospiraceae bacterium]|nr:uroporphyrinogen decarboxylase [Spirochaetaceae bacterium]HBS05784.1 uroporphyrinogen decarboxylase [Leptospiraceae bacterium]|tara:strand:- start:467 stop:1513 length:1047 start_codon:yes stop_codon:yes gene_type:complete